MVAPTFRCVFLLQLTKIKKKMPHRRGPEFIYQVNPDPRQIDNQHHNSLSIKDLAGFWEQCFKALESFDEYNFC